ncbi:tRNA splicing endonuclease subunit 34 [Arctopsyche grandis]|uniref:tRNA splicing endonuclease subunit 34 n=1 Tax=Arctopsyche grandis TaxID=121162 RepID=UPI00406D967D
MIPLYVSNGQAFVWNANDWLTIRQNHRIVGELIGSIASFPRQDSYPGFPMALMTEEAALLVEEGFCKLLEYTNSNALPSSDLSKLAKETEDRLFTEQTDCMKEKRIEQMSSRIDIIVAGKQKKKAMEGDSSECDKEALLQEEILKLTPLSVGNSLVQIPTEDPWPHETKDITIEDLIPNIKSDIGHVRYSVFKDLWKRGFFVTAGTKFGGDFLVYLGDPVKFHAMYMVKCLNNSSEIISLKRIVAFGRLGVSVNKITVIAYINNDNNVTYQTLQWHDTLY